VISLHNCWTTLSSSCCPAVSKRFCKFCRVLRNSRTTPQSSKLLSWYRPEEWTCWFFSLISRQHFFITVMYFLSPRYLRAVVLCTVLSHTTTTGQQLVIKLYNSCTTISPSENPALHILLIQTPSILSLSIQSSLYYTPMTPLTWSHPPDPPNPVSILWSLQHYTCHLSSPYPTVINNFNMYTIRSTKNVLYQNIYCFKQREDLLEVNDKLVLIYEYFN